MRKNVAGRQLIPGRHLREHLDAGVQRCLGARLREIIVATVIVVLEEHTFLHEGFVYLKLDWEFVSLFLDEKGSWLFGLGEFFGIRIWNCIVLNDERSLEERHFLYLFLFHFEERVIIRNSFFLLL